MGRLKSLHHSCQAGTLTWSNHHSSHLVHLSPNQSHLPQITMNNNPGTPQQAAKWNSSNDTKLCESYLKRKVQPCPTRQTYPDKDLHKKNWEHKNYTTCSRLIRKKLKEFEADRIIGGARGKLSAYSCLPHHSLTNRFIQFQQATTRIPRRTEHPKPTVRTRMEKPFATRSWTTTILTCLPLQQLLVPRLRPAPPRRSISRKMT